MQNWSVKSVSLLEDAQLWDQLCASSAVANVFASSAWLTVLAEVFGRLPSAEILLQDGEPAAGIPLLSSRRGPLRIVPPLPITLYAGWIHAPRHPVSPAAAADLLHRVERLFHFAAIGLPPGDSLASVLGTRGWTLHRRQSRRLDITDREALWHGYSQSLRRKIRRAQESDLHLDTGPSSSQLAECYALSYQRHGIAPPIPSERIRIWIDELRRRDMIHLFAARRADGRCAATRAVLRDGDVLYDWLAGANPEVAPSASHWLVHALLEHFGAAGCRQFDFMGANTPGVSDFKRSFGGSALAYFDAEWYRPAILKSVNRLRGRSIRRRRGIR